jgi:hypothetical protein
VAIFDLEYAQCRHSQIVTEIGDIDSTVEFDRPINPHRGVFAVHGQCLATSIVMASRDNATDDDYVAQLLAKEAEEASKKYSQLGVRALLPTR